MLLYRTRQETFEALPETSFGREGMSERRDLQRLLRADISPLGDDLLLVLSEEFGEWEDRNRRIDLLCLDKDARLVVIEIKRTEDGGHMELQAVRYAAMISGTTMDHAIVILYRSRKSCRLENLACRSAKRSAFTDRPIPM